MLTKALALELAPHKILVNSVAPVSIRTPGTKATMIAHMEKGLDPAELAKNVDTHGQSPWHFSKTSFA